MFQVWWQWAFVLYCLGTGIVLGWIWASEPLKRKVKALESVIELDSAQKMERVLALESRSRLELEKVQALELDLERAQSKWMWKE